MVFNNNLLLGAAGAAGGYTIDQSIRFNNNDTAYMTRTPASAGNRKLWTLSLWFKRCSISETQVLFAAAPTGINEIRFGSTTNTIYYDWSSVGVYPETTAVLRDTSAWYHLVTVYDTDNATAADRLQCYLNGTRLTLSQTFSSGTLSSINNNVVHAIGISSYSIPNYYPWDGYVAEVNFIDGQALGPSYFGETDATTGQWVPIAYTGSYGTNGFYITGENSAALGTDYSGNGNNFTTSGLTSADQVTDTPTNNFCTLNAIDKATQVTLADGNLQYGLSSNSYTAVRGTFGVSSGKWYWEMSTVSGMAVNTVYMGIATNASNLQVSNAPGDGTTYTYISYTGNKAYTSSTAYGTAWNTNGRVIGVALDLDAGKIWWSRDGVWQASGDPAAGSNEAFSGITGTWHPYVVFNDVSPNLLFNFGQSAFTYTPPTGFKALSTANLSDSTIADPTAYFNTVLWTATGATNAITGVGFQPDFIWGKKRTPTADNHGLVDAVRGNTKQLASNLADAELTNTNGVQSFDADGFTLAGSGAGSGVWNGNVGATHVAWNWKANGSGTSNTDGSITSTVSANTTSGFSVVTYTGTGANATVGHGLGVAPSMLIVKNRIDADSWVVYHKSIGATKGLTLDTSDLPATASTFFNDTAPTSSVFSVGSGGRTNGSSDGMLAYCFAEVDGFSKAGSYVANASTDGPFVYCGFRPAWVIFFMIAGSGAGRSILDSVRDPYNPEDSILQANTTAVESSGSSYYTDFLSNGFKLRTSSDFNGSGRTVAFMAFAESPFKTANAR